MTWMASGAAHPTDLASLVDGYTAVWSEADSEARRKAVGRLWRADGVEFVEGVQFRGHEELTARIGRSYDQFVATGEYAIRTAGDAAGHGDVVTFTVQLIALGGDAAGEPAWSARVFLLLDEDGIIREDYHVTVQPLAS
ncbi:hypothetical protein [Streptomyces sp. CA-111067]|uniref:hypothetical protein n=1 Tax=Streptomyces sp. CA-111067 TaxID=3240046 RepID=UPI003D983F03